MCGRLPLADDVVGSVHAFGRRRERDASRRDQPATVKDAPAVPAGRGKLAAAQDAQEPDGGPRDAVAAPIPVADGAQADPEQLGACPLAQTEAHPKLPEAVRRDVPDPAPRGPLGTARTMRNAYYVKSSAGHSSVHPWRCVRELQFR